MQVTFVEYPQIKRITFKSKNEDISDKVLKGTVVNQTYHSINLLSLEITSTVASNEVVEQIIKDIE